MGGKMIKFHNFKVGERLKHNWTNSYNYYSADVEVVKVNPKSVRVKLLTIPGNSGYEIGRVWTVKTDVFSSTANNCLHNDNKEILISCY